MFNTISLIGSQLANVSNASLIVFALLVTSMAAVCSDCFLHSLSLRRLSKRRLWSLYYLSFAKSLVYKTNVANELPTKNVNMIYSSQRRWLSMGTNSNPKSSHRFGFSMRIVKNVFWYPIPLALGVVYISYKRFKYVKQRENQELETSDVLGYQGSIATNIEISLIKLLPLRFLSRIWGFINSVYLPLWLREPIIGGYSRLFQCDVHEALIDDLKSYNNLGQFFRRDLKPGLRPIANGSVVSPADGTVLHFGKVENEMIEQVKGVTYSLPAFLGPQTWKNTTENMTAAQYHQNLFYNKVEDKNTSLFHCVIYLAPGDYHKFHSPCEWQVNFRRHFPGKLLSVRPSFASWFPRLFTVNERVAYIGKWMHGFFSLTAVGATNVGSIKVYCDEDLRTNKMFNRRTTYIDRTYVDNVNFSKGDSFGEFNFGSTIVLIFEAPNNFTFSIKTGDRIKYGQLLSDNRENI